MEYGIALGGGGVRGAYQIGVWKALREMNISLCAAVGSSIGAINAALMVQGEYEKANDMWRNISLDDIIDLPKSMEGEKNIFTIKNLTGMAKDIQKNAGLNMKPLENILRSIIKEEKIRNSQIDFGLAAFSLTDKKGVYMMKNQIDQGKLIDYIMASAGILTAKKIKKETYSDGGMFDNIPITMLLDKGIKNIIAVDVQGIGINRSFQDAGINIIQIKSQNPTTGIMDFDTEGIKKAISEGYYDCLKAFNRISGEMYFIEGRSYRAAEKNLSGAIMGGLEKAAKILGVERLRIYTFPELKKEVMQEFSKQWERGVNLEGANLDSIIKSGENAMLMWLVKTIENKSIPPVIKLSALGEVYDAASAILYFKN